MFDAVDPIVMPEDSAADCPGCNAAFIPNRSNQRYCSPECQRCTSRNASRGSRSDENRTRSWRHYDRAHRLTEMIYTPAPQERLGVMKHILGFIPNDAGLRNILTDRKLHMTPPRADNRMNIAKAANAYTQKFFGLSIRRYIKAVREGEEPEGIPPRP
ncbi:hypothetical protein ACEWPL_004375 [Roseovarius sp. S1116L3]|uniref:hypothetical protein n=1 Tax=Roseovarius roseus TaxID=3342636 RepID=UPI00372AB57D